MTQASPRIGDERVGWPVADGRPNLLDSFFSGQIGSHGFDLRTVLPQFLRSRFDFRFIGCDDQVISVAGAAFCKFQTDPGGRAGHDREWAISHEKSDRKSVVKGKSVSVRVDIGGRLIIKKKIKNKKT